MDLADPACLLRLLVGKDLLGRFGWILAKCLHLLLRIREVAHDDVLALGLLGEGQVEDHISEIFFVGQCQTLVGVESREVAIGLPDQVELIAGH